MNVYHGIIVSTVLFLIGCSTEVGTDVDVSSQSTSSSSTMSSLSLLNSSALDESSQEKLQAEQSSSDAAGESSEMPDTWSSNNEQLFSSEDNSHQSATTQVSTESSETLFSIPHKTQQGEKPVQVDVTISINATESIGVIRREMHGINATTYTGNYVEDGKLLGYLKEMGASTVRFPGGDMSNMYFFDQKPSDLPGVALTFDGEWTDFTSGLDGHNGRMNTSSFYDLLNQTNAEGFITVNYAYARYGTSDDPVKAAASYAADWVRFDNGRTQLWEVGNETYACWEGGFKINPALNKDGQSEYISGELYGQHFKVFSDSMKAAAASIGHEIMVGAVFADADDIWDGSSKDVTKNWNSQLAQQLKKQDGGNYADFITVHSYFLEAGENAPEQILNSATHVPEKLQNFVYQKLDDAGASRVPVSLSEWNIRRPWQSDQDGRQTTHIGAMHAITAITKMHQLEFLSSNYFGIKDYWRKEDGDFALFGNNDPDHPNSEPYPLFYHFYYYNKILGGERVATSGEQDGVITLATTFSDGGLGVVIINTLNQNRSVALEISGAELGENYYWYEVTSAGDDLWSQKVAVNGETNDWSIKGGPDNLSAIAAYTQSTEGKVAVLTKGYSITYLMIE